VNLFFLFFRSFFWYCVYMRGISDTASDIEEHYFAFESILSTCSAAAARQGGERCRQMAMANEKYKRKNRHFSFLFIFMNENLISWVHFVRPLWRRCTTADDVPGISRFFHHCYYFFQSNRIELDSMLMEHRKWRWSTVDSSNLKRTCNLKQNGSAYLFCYSANNTYKIFK
jgi:hypothetical protein